MGFIVGIFVVGAVATAMVGFLGVSGHLGTGIPGTGTTRTPAATPLSQCQGHDGSGSFRFTIIAQPGGALRFNGSSPGPCFAVQVGSQVTVNFSVDYGAREFSSWELVAGTGPVSGPSALTPVFPGAGWSNATRFNGLYAGQSTVFTFRASVAGAYRYVSEVSAQAAVGMWGPFNVTSPTVGLPSVAHASAGFGSPILAPRIEAALLR